MHGVAVGVRGVDEAVGCRVGDGLGVAVAVGGAICVAVAVA
jgi:hypothetical protein